MSFQSLSPKAAAGGQVRPDDLAEIRDAGITRIINNRLDGERPGQPTSAEVEGWVRAAGLDYAWIPVAGRPTEPNAQAVADLLADGEPTLLYCLSGLRSAAVWAMAAVRTGEMTADEAREAAAGAGFDLSGLPL